MPSASEGRHGLLVAAHAADAAGVADDQAERDGRALIEGGEGDVLPRGRGDQHLGLAVLQDVGELFRGEMGVDAGVVEARALARGAGFEIAGVVLHEDGVVVERSEPGGAQEMGEPIAARFQFPVGDPFARSSHDDRRLIGACLSVRPWIHPLPPEMRGSIPAVLRPATPGNRDCLRRSRLSRRGRHALSGQAWRSGCRRRPAKC